MSRSVRLRKKYETTNQKLTQLGIEIGVIAKPRIRLLNFSGFDLDLYAESYCRIFKTEVFRANIADIYRLATEQTL